jgi:hypothetical protein
LLHLLNNNHLFILTTFLGLKGDCYTRVGLTSIQKKIAPVNFKIKKNPF